MGFIISMLIGWGVLLAIVGTATGKDPVRFALVGVGMTIALGFLSFFLMMIYLLIK